MQTYASRLVLQLGKRLLETKATVIVLSIACCSLIFACNKTQQQSSIQTSKKGKKRILTDIEEDSSQLKRSSEKFNNLKKKLMMKHYHATTPDISMQDKTREYQSDTLSFFIESKKDMEQWAKKEETEDRLFFILYGHVVK